MGPGILWFTFFLAYAVFATARPLYWGPQLFQQSATPHSLLFSLSMWNELCNQLFHLLIFSTCGLIFIVCCSLCAVTYQKEKKERCFFNVKKQDAVFLMCKSKVECLNREKIYFLPCQSYMQIFLLKKIFTACVMATISMFLCFLQENL